MESIFRLTEPARFEPAFQIYRKETAMEKRIIDTIPMCYSVGAMRSEGGLKLIYAGEGNGRVAVTTDLTTATGRSSGMKQRSSAAR